MDWLMLGLLGSSMIFILVEKMFALEDSGGQAGKYQDQIDAVCMHRLSVALASSTHVSLHRR